MTNMTKNDFNKTIIKILEQDLRSFKGSSVNREVSLQIYNIIFNIISNIFQKSNIIVSNVTINYISQQYYYCIRINNNQELDPNIFTMLAKVENITTKELGMLACMFSNSDLVYPIIHELRKR